MSAREAILQRVRQNRPGAVALPEISFPAPEADLIAAFAEAVIAAGGVVVECADGPLAAAVASQYPAERIITSCLPPDELPDARAFERGSADEYATLDVLVCAGVLGVAENGCVWLPESRMGDRAAPFLAQHLALVLDARDIVATMHQAYARVQTDAEGFGVFIAGPSKTADIEQSLVIGAHGPRSLTIFLRP